MKIKTSELIGPALDWAVAKCVDWGTYLSDLEGLGYTCYSTDWEQGGPIIEREKLTIDALEHYWVAYKRPCEISQRMTGLTPLIAAMRCFVASKLGDEVDIPEELS